MSEMWNDIEEFHQEFCLPQADEPAVELNEHPDIMDFRVRFLDEELAEFKDALKEGDRVKAFDALMDLTYVAMGTAYIMNSQKKSSAAMASQLW